MKKIRSITVLIGIAICLVSFSFSNPNPIEKLEGKWENTQFEISYTFSENSVYFEQGSFGQRFDMKLDTTKSPMWLDFSVKRGSYEIIIPSLVEFVDENTIVIEQFTPNQDHPTAFTKEGEGMNKKHTLNRVK